MPAKTSKYLRIYGMTLQQISKHLELSVPTIHALLNGKRKNYHPLTLKRFNEFLKEQGEIHDTSHGAGDGQPAQDKP